MADQYSNDGSSSSNAPGESSDSTVQLNIKTLDSQIYTFEVEKNMQVSLFKEKIASKIGVPIGQQRLIFRGKVLKDEHPLSEYHVENGHTLHLVERQPAQTQPSSGTGPGETSENTNNQGNDASTGAPRNRVGQISHSVVLGTFNVGEQGEGIIPDLNRVIGAVLNSIGVGGQSTTSGTQASAVPNTSGPYTQGNEMDGARGSVGGQSHAGNQSQTGQGSPQLFQSFPQVLPIPLAPIVPSINAPIPDSLNTLSEFMSRMEQALSQNGYQQHSSSTNAGGQPRGGLPSNARGMATPEALGIVLRHAEQLLRDHAIASLSHIAGRLEQEGASTDPTTRGQIQTESVRVGLAMQHFGALLLEIGRTILTLRMGQSPTESVVNAGPAVYISPSGPNPIMVQPFPLQSSSLFSGSAAPNPIPFGPVAAGNAPRHVNIHIHAGTSLAPIISAVGGRASNVEGMQGERSNTVGSGDSGTTRALPVRNVIATAVPSRPAGAVISTAANPGLGVSASQPSSDPVSLSSVIAEVNSQIRNFVGSMQADNLVPSGQSETTAQSSSEQLGASLPGSRPEGQKPAGCSSNSKDVSTSLPGASVSSGGDTAAKSENVSENAPSSSKNRGITEGGEALPLGLGLSLERKKRGKQDKSLVKGGDSGTASTSLDQNQQSRISAQHVLQSLASRSSAVNRMDANDPPSRPGLVMDGRPLVGQGSSGQLDSVMSQVLNSPALNGLLGGVSEQTGVGSPDVLRNMLQQMTQSPQMMNTVNQIAQQVDRQDLGNMFGGMGRGQGGGMDFSRMIQQMMPIVSQALSGGSTSLPSFPVEPEPQPQHNQNNIRARDQNIQINLQDIVQTIENQNPPGDIFRAIVQNAVGLSGNETDREDLLDELCGNEGLASEYVEMLRRDLSRQQPGDSEHD